MTTSTAAPPTSWSIAPGRRCLPIAGPSWPATPVGADLVELLVAPGTPVHVATAGRVVEVGGTLAGEVVVRDEDERQVHYRRLLPSSIRVREGERVAAGTVLGVAGAATAGALGATVLFGVRSPEGDWLDVGEVLVGATDPDELFVVVAEVVDDPLVPGTAAPPTRAAAPRPGVELGGSTGLRVAGPGPAVEDAAERAGDGVVPSPAAAGPGGPPRPDRAGGRAARRPADPKRIASARQGNGGAPASGPAGSPPPAPVTATVEPEPDVAPPPGAPAPGAGGAEPAPSGAEPGGATPPAADAAPAPGEAAPGVGPATPEQPPGPEQPPAPERSAAEAQDVLRKLAGRSRRKER